LHPADAGVDASVDVGTGDGDVVDDVPGIEAAASMLSIAQTTPLTQSPLTPNIAHAAHPASLSAPQPIVFVFCYVLNEVFGKSMDSRGFELVATLLHHAADSNPAGALCLFREPNEWTVQCSVCL
jgi:hypothetical protein